MRLNKFLASKTGLSRRAADVAIESGKVKVNSRKASLGSILNIGDHVEFESKTYTYTTNKTKRIVIALNKPPGLICSSSDAQGDTVIGTILPAIQEALGMKRLKLFSVGRLDKESRGLLLLTNDGDLANQLTHPSFGQEKEYIVTLRKPVTESFIAKFAKGVYIEVSGKKTKTKPCKVEQISDSMIRVVLEQGYKRQIRLMTKALANDVTDLLRIRIGDIAIKNKYLDKSQKLRFLLKLQQGEFIEIKY